MRAAVVLVSFGFLLACGGLATEPPVPPPPPPPQPEVLPVTISTEAPPPADPQGLHAIYTTDALAPIVCWSAGKPVESCESLVVPEGGLAATIVDVDLLGEGPVEIVVGAGRVTPPPPDEPCEMVGAEGPATTTPWAHTRAVIAQEEVPAAFASEFGAAVQPDALYAVDFEGDGTTEVVFSAETERGRVIGVVRDGRVIVLGDDRRDPLPEDADEQAQMEYELSRGTTGIVGLTDAGLDGTLELVLKIDGYESVFWTVVTSTGARLGGSGCAI
jgi:hypothetical protein